MTNVIIIFCYRKYCLGTFKCQENKDATSTCRSLEAHWVNDLDACKQKCSNNKLCKALVLHASIEPNGCILYETRCTSLITMQNSSYCDRNLPVEV